MTPSPVSRLSDILPEKRHAPEATGLTPRALRRILGRAYPTVRGFAGFLIRYRPPDQLAPPPDCAQRGVGGR